VLASAPVFPSVRRPGSALTERAVNFIIKEAAERAGVNPAASIDWLRHAHASHAIDNGAPITPVSATLGHADLKTTSVYAHARPGESNGLRCYYWQRCRLFARDKRNEGWPFRTWN
jgi:site-specific recombinase XerD